MAAVHGQQKIKGPATRKHTKQAAKTVSERLHNMKKKKQYFTDMQVATN